MQLCLNIWKNFNLLSLFVLNSKLIFEALRSLSWELPYVLYDLLDLTSWCSLLVDCAWVWWFGYLFNFLLVGGWLASLSVAGYTAITIRRIVKTKMIPAEPMARPSPFSNIELWAWTAIFVSSLVLAFVSPTALGTSARTCLPFLLASTVLGYMIGIG